MTKPNLNLSKLLSKIKKKEKKVEEEKLKKPSYTNKKGKNNKLTSILKAKKVNEALVKFINSLQEPFTRRGFLESWKSFTKLIVHDKKIHRNLKNQILRSLNKIKEVFANLQEETLIEKLKILREEVNPVVDNIEILDEDTDIQQSLSYKKKRKSPNIMFLVENITKQSIENDTRSLINTAIEISLELEDSESITNRESDIIKEKLSILLDNLNDEKIEIINYLITHPKEAKNIIFWIKDNAHSKSGDEIWEKIEDIIPYIDKEADTPYFDELLNSYLISNKKDFLASYKKGKDPYEKSEDSGKSKHIIYLSHEIDKLSKNEILHKRRLISDVDMKKINDQAKDQFQLIGITIDAVKKLLELNEKTSIFLDIYRLQELKLFIDDSEERIELNEKITKLLNEIKFDSKHIIGKNKKIDIIKIPKEDKKGVDLYLAVAPMYYEDIIDSKKPINNKNNNLKSINPIYKDPFETIPKTILDVYNVRIKDSNGRLKLSDLATKILSIIEAIITDVFKKYLWHSMFDDNYYVQVFRENYLDNFIKVFMGQIKDNSSTIGEVVTHVAKFILFFKLDDHINSKNLFILTNLIGSLNGRESGEYFRSLILQRRLLPKGILEQLMLDKLPFVFINNKIKKQEIDIINTRLNLGIKRIKQEIVQSILIHLDHTRKDIKIIPLLKGKGEGKRSAEYKNISDSKLNNFLLFSQKTKKEIEELDLQVYDINKLNEVLEKFNIVKKRSVKTKQQIINLIKSYLDNIKKEINSIVDEKDLRDRASHIQIKEDCIIIHDSCNSTSENNVLYVEKIYDHDKNCEVETIYCFDLLELYSDLVENTILINKHSGNKFEQSFIEDIKSISHSNNITKLKEKDSLIKIKKWGRNKLAKNIQKWFRKIRSKKDIKYTIQSNWAIKYLLDLPEVKEEIKQKKIEEMQKKKEEIIEAATYGKLFSIKKLLKLYGDSLATEDLGKGYTLLHWISNAPDTQESEELIKYIAGIKNVDINAYDDMGFTPLHLASTQGNFHQVKAFLELGAIIDTIDTEFASTPINSVCLGGLANIKNKEKILNMLATYSKDEDVFANDSDSDSDEDVVLEIKDDESSDESSSDESSSDSSSDSGSDSDDSSEGSMSGGYEDKVSQLEEQCSENARIDEKLCDKCKKSGDFNTIKDHNGIKHIRICTKCFEECDLNKF